jgi:hypothetical protein
MRNVVMTCAGRKLMNFASVKQKIYNPLPELVMWYTVLEASFSGSIPMYTSSSSSGSTAGFQP